MHEHTGEFQRLVGGAASCAYRGSRLSFADRLDFVSLET